MDKHVRAMKASVDAFAAFGRAMAETSIMMERQWGTLIAAFHDRMIREKRAHLAGKLSGWMPDRWAAFIAERWPERWLIFVRLGSSIG